MAKVSLCMMVKNEEAMLAPCLESVQGLADEIIVVDTGSEDRTRDIARELGAVVLEQPWEEDFSKPRNLAVEHCSGEWVLLLDADERLAPGAAPQIRAALETADWDGAFLPIFNASHAAATPAGILSGEERLDEGAVLLRLFRKSETLRWSGRIHENVLAWVQEKKRVFGRLNTPILHYGGHDDIRGQRNKRERNLRLLRRSLEEDPDDSQLWSHYASELDHAGMPAESAEAVTRAWESLRTRVERGEKPARVPVCNLYMRRLLSEKRFEEVLEVGRWSKRGDGEHPSILFKMGLAHEWMATQAEQPLQRRQCLQRALACFHRCLKARYELFYIQPDPHVTGWAAGNRLGAIFLALGEPDMAPPFFEGVLEQEPAQIEALLGLAEVALQSGAVDAAKRQLLAVPEGQSLDRLILMLSCMIPEPTPQQARGMLRKIKEHQALPLLAPHRFSRIEVWQERARELAREAAEAQAREASLEALLSRRPLAAGAPSPSLEAVLSRVPALLQEGQISALESLLSPRAESLVPGSHQAVIELLAQLGLPVEDDGEPELIFLGGSGRCGASLLQSLLSAHPRIRAAGEIPLLGELMESHQRWTSTAQELGAGVLDRSTRAFLFELLTSLQGESPRVIGSAPRLLQHASPLMAMFPRARFLQVVRDGRAVVASLLQQPRLDADQQPAPRSAELRQAAASWESSVLAVRRQAELLGEQLCTVRWEDLVRQPRETLQRVLAFLGEPWAEEVLDAHPLCGPAASVAGAQVASDPALDPHATEAWRAALSPAQQQELNEILGPTLVSLGYAV